MRGLFGVNANVWQGLFGDRLAYLDWKSFLILMAIFVGVPFFFSELFRAMELLNACQWRSSPRPVQISSS